MPNEQNLKVAIRRDHIDAVRDAQRRMADSEAALDAMRQRHLEELEDLRKKQRALREAERKRRKEELRQAQKLVRTAKEQYFLVVREGLADVGGEQASASG